MYGQNCAICDEFPSETKSEEIRTFFCQFGELHNIWLQEYNGQETRQTLIFFKSGQELQEAISNKDKIFNDSQITIEKCSEQLIEIGEIYFQLIDEQNQDELKKKAKYHYEDNIISNISGFLDLELLTFTANSLMLSKFCSYILQIIIKCIPQSVEDNQIKIIFQQFIKYIPIRKVSRNHTLFLLAVLQSEKTRNQLQQQGQGLLIGLSQYLQHSNIDVKIDSITSMFLLISSENEESDNLKIHPFYSQLKDQGIILSIQQNCLNVENFELKKKSALFLGTLLQCQDIELNLRHQLISELKKGIYEENNNQITIDILQILCGLAIKECLQFITNQNKSFYFNFYQLSIANIAEIVSDCFIDDAIKLSKSTKEDISICALKLLLLIVNKCQSEIEQQIKSKIQNMEFMSLLGEMDSSFDHMIFEITLKWNNNNEQLINFQSLYEANENFMQETWVSKQETILQDKIIPLSQSILNSATEAIIQQEQQDEEAHFIIQQSMLNSCEIIIQIVKGIQYYLNMIMESEIPQIIIKYLNNVSFEQTRINPMELLFHIIKKVEISQKRQLYNLGVIQTLSRFLKHTKKSIIQLSALSIICIINSGNLLISPHSEHKLIFPIHFQHPYFIELHKDGIIDTIEQRCVYHQSNNRISMYLFEILTTLIAGNDLPIDLLNIIIQQTKQSMETKLQQKQSIQIEITILQYISLNKNNHAGIINNNILPVILSNILQQGHEDQKHILYILSIIYEFGDLNIRQQLDELTQDNQIDRMINRQDYIYLFQFNEQNADLRTKQSKVYNTLSVNRAVFCFLGWKNEFERMNQISSIKRYIFQEIENDLQENAIGEKNENQIVELQKKDEENIIIQNKEENNKDNKQFQKIQRLILIVKQIKDKELQYGAMTIVQQIIYSILFQSTLNWDENVIIKQISQLQQLVDGNDDEILFNFLDFDICKCLQFILEKCLIEDQPLQLKFKIVQLLSSLAVRGVLMSRYDEQNHFTQIFIISGIIKTLKKILEAQQNEQKIEEQINTLKKRIKLLAAITYSCLLKRQKVQNNIISTCDKIFHTNLISFIDNLQQSSFPEFEIQFQNQMEMERKIGIDEIEFEKIINILIAVGCLGADYHNSLFLIQYNQILKDIQPFIHINCNCIFKISLSNSLFITNLKTATFFALSQLFNAMNYEIILQFYVENNLFVHILPYIFSNSAFNNLNHNTISNSLISQTNETTQINFESYHDTSAFILLRVMMLHTEQVIGISLIQENKLFEKIMNILSNLVNESIQTKQTSIMKYSYLQLIQGVNECEELKVIKYMINNLNEIKLISNLMSSAGGKERSDDDDIITTNNENLSTILIMLQKTNNLKEIQQIGILILDYIEEDNLIEELNAFLYHTDTREDFGVKDSAGDVLRDIEYVTAKINSQIYEQEFEGKSKLQSLYPVHQDSEDESDD